MDLSQETDQLRNIPMFAKLDSSKLKLLAFTSELVKYADGDTVFSQGDSPDCAYVIMNGDVDVISETESGPLVASTLRQNQLFGEMALLNNVPRVATMKANGDLLVMRITGEMFLKLISENSDVSLDVMRQLSSKLSMSTHQVGELQNQLSDRQ